MLAIVTGVTSSYSQELEITGLSAERLLLETRTANDVAPSPGELVEIRIINGMDRFGVLDGEVIAPSSEQQLVVRIVNLDAPRRQALSNLSRDVGLDGARGDHQPGEYRKTVGGRGRRKRMTTAVMEQKDLEALTRQDARAERSAGGETSSFAGAAARSDSESDHRIHYTSLNEALLAATSSDATRSAPSEPSAGAPAKSPPPAPPAALRLTVSPDTIDWSRVDPRAAIVLSVINGTRDIEEVVSASPLSRTATLLIVEQLRAHGLLVEVAERDPKTT
jgi:hypothetical protein